MPAFFAGDPTKNRRKLHGPGLAVRLSSAERLRELLNQIGGFRAFRQVQASPPGLAVDRARFIRRAGWLSRLQEQQISEC